jgi:ABC-type multidrug transport system fused ATPase/permease subunit
MASLLQLRLRHHLLASLMSLMIISFGYFSKSPGVQTSSSIGLVLSQSLTFTDSVFYYLISVGAMDAEMNALERLAYYGNYLACESDSKLPTDPLTTEWPTNERIVFENVEMIYPARPDYKVLNNISYEIQSGEKIGIIGRTGSGKLTLATALFRLMEISGGKILICDMDISKLD